MLDRYILAKLAVLRDDLTAAMDLTDISGACEQLRRQFTEALDELVCTTVAFAVLGRGPRRHRHLHTVLEVTTRLAAPLLPMATEVIWRGLTGGRSCTLADWPPGGCVARRPRTWWPPWTGCATCSAAPAAQGQEAAVRLPLPKLTVAVDNVGIGAVHRPDRRRTPMSKPSS